MSTHTPGPWRLSRHQPGDGKRILIVDDGGDNWDRLTCEVDSDDCNSEMAAANALLIAAAPDLLDACKQACCCIPDRANVKKIVLAAIAKASGGAS